MSIQIKIKEGNKITDKTFIRITNKDIYDKVEEVCNHVKMTNGKVKLNKWIATTALSFVIILLGCLLNHII